MTDKEPALNPKYYKQSLKTLIRDTYEEIKYWRKKEIDCTFIIDGAYTVDTYSEKCKENIDKLEKQLKEALQRYNDTRNLDGEQLAKYFQYRDLKKELDL